MSAVEDTILGIRQELTSFMNGESALAMRRRGIEYKLNYGVSLPDLRKIAAGHPHDRKLADALWKQECRECMMLGAMLYPVESFFPEMADLWLERIVYPDLAEVCSAFLFPLMKEASAVSMRWIASDSPMARYCGFLTMAHLLREGREMNAGCRDELEDQVKTALQSHDALTREGAAAVMQMLENVRDGE